MIHTNELRVGNWVDTTGGYQWVEYIGVDVTLSDGDIRNYDDIYPITLTPEILEKAGFRLQPQKTSIYIKGRLKLWLGHNGAIAYLNNEDTDEIYYIPKNPQSLHELQNIHYYITGEELSIQL